LIDPPPSTSKVHVSGEEKRKGKKGKKKEKTRRESRKALFFLNPAEKLSACVDSVDSRF